MKVLLGIGGTDDSVRALERVVDRTRETGDDMTVAVLDNPASDTTPDAVERRVRGALGEAGLANTVDVRHLGGPPAPTLVELAESEGFDRLVLGGGQRSPMGKISLGDVAEYVLLNARVSVTLVR
jgi:nucleotide-binding universal stress UspA family protein